MRPTKAHRLRVEAEMFSALQPQTLTGLEGYDLLLAQLNIHKRQLKGVQSMERRAEMKKGIFAEYQPWIDGVLAKGTGLQDAVLMTWLVWCLDTQNYDYAIKIGTYALFHDLAMPEQFNRSTATVLAEELADMAKKARDVKADFNLDYLTQAYELTEDHDMPDEVRAKLLREMGEREKDDNAELALLHLKRAFELDSNVDVKGSIAKLEKALGKEQAEPTDPKE